MNRIHETKHRNNIPAIHVTHDYFKNWFFSSTIFECNKFDWKIRNLGSLPIFKKNLLKFTWSCANSIFDINNPYGIKLLKWLRLDLSHLHDHKFRHCFQDIQNPLCDWSSDTETTTHFFLYCPSFQTPRQTLLNNIRNINEWILSHGKDQLIQTFLHGNTKCTLTVNRLSLNATIEYLLSTEKIQISSFQLINVVRCAIWYHLYNLKNVKNTHGGVLILVKLQSKSLQLY